MRLLLMIMSICWLSSGFSAQNPQGHSTVSYEREVRNAVLTFRNEHQHEIIREYIELLSIPNHSYDSEAILENAEFIARMLEKRGFTAEIFDAGYENPKNPVLYGERSVPGAVRTLLFYAHYDGQRVIPAQWTETDPYKPVLRPGKLEADTGIPAPIPFPGTGESYEDDWRIYARSASDDKAPVIALMAAVDALDDAGILLTNNIKIVLDGAEEEGSAHLLEFIENHSAMLESDVIFICDGPVYPTGQPTLYFGNRGIQSLTITVYGPNTNLHSGHYGNWAPNPAYKLARLLTSFKDSDGNVLVDGFYDTAEPLNKRELQALDQLPRLDEQLKNQYGFARPDGFGKSLNELINRPSLNIRWLDSGMNRTIIPKQASVLMDIRLVKGTAGSDMVEKLSKHIEKQGFYIVNEDPDHETRMNHPDIVKITAGHATPASRTSMELPVSLGVIKKMSNTFDRDVALIPSLGGTIPTYMFTEILAIPAIGVPIANPDNNQHQYDENIRIGNFWRGIETFAVLLLSDW
jgi:acetylornithine deacetylase/succinyl-diaminopimelate desuccinylase-like protein